MPDSENAVEDSSRFSTFIQKLLVVATTIVLCSHFATGIMIRTQPLVAYGRDVIGTLLLVGLFLFNIRRWHKGLSLAFTLPCLYIVVFVPLLFDRSLALTALLTLKWPIMWMTALLLGYTASTLTNQRSIFKITLLALLGFFTFDGVLAIRESRTNQYFYEVRSSDSTAAGVQIARQLSLQGSIRPRATQRDTFALSNEMAAAALLALCAASAAESHLLRFAFFIGAAFFSYCTFLSSGRTGLIGLMVGALFWCLAVLFRRRLKLLVVPVLILAAALFCVQFFGIGRLTTAISQTFFSSTVAGSDESAYMRDKLWGDLLAYRNRSEVVKYCGWPTAVAIGETKPPSFETLDFHTDNAYLYTLVCFGIAGVILHFGILYKYLLSAPVFAHAGYSVAMVTFLAFVLAEGIGRESQFFYGSLVFAAFAGRCLYRGERQFQFSIQ